MKKVFLYLQQPHQLEIAKLTEFFPKLAVLLKKKGLFVEALIKINTCFKDSTPNLVFFSDIKDKTVTSPLEILTEKEANLLVALIKKSE
jgi:hypothetical protein